MFTTPALPIDLPLDALQVFCRKWDIQELALFGSVLRADFGADSDLDLLAQFADRVRYSLFDLVRMGHELEQILGRRVDLIDRRALEQSENYLRREEILNTAQVIYAA